MHRHSARVAILSSAEVTTPGNGTLREEGLACRGRLIVSVKKPGLTGGRRRPDQRIGEKKISSHIVTYRKGFRYVEIYNHVKAP